MFNKTAIFLDYFDNNDFLLVPVTRSQTKKALINANLPTRSAKILERRQTIALDKRNVVDETDSNNRPMLFKNIVTKPFRPRRHSEMATVAPLISEGGDKF